MDSRKKGKKTTFPRPLHNYETINVQNISQQTEVVEKRLGLESNSLNAIFNSREWSDRLDEELERKIVDISKSAGQLILATTAIFAAEDQTVSAYMNAKSSDMRERLEVITKQLSTRKQSALDAFQKECDAARNHLLQSDSCHAGNHAGQLANIKRNIAIAMLNAAYYAWHESKEAVKKNPNTFNQIFTPFAQVEARKKDKLRFKFTKYVGRKYADDSLGKIQEKISEHLKKCKTLQADTFPANIRAQLKHVNELCAQQFGINELITIDDTKVTFSPQALEIEKHAEKSRAEARKVVEGIYQNYANKVSDLTDDDTLRDKTKELSELAENINTNIETFRKIVYERNRQMKVLETQKSEIAAIYTQIESLDKLIPVNSRDESLALLKNIELSETKRNQIADGLEEVRQNIYASFKKDARITELTEQRTWFEHVYKIATDELNSQVDIAAKKKDGLTFPTDAFSDIQKRLQNTRGLIDEFNPVLSSVMQEHSALGERFNSERSDLINMLEELDHNSTDFEVRLDAILSNLSDMTQRFSEHEDFKGTRLDDVVIDHLYDTQQRAEAAQTAFKGEQKPAVAEQPAAERAVVLAVNADEPAKKPGFWQRHPVAKRVLIGAAIGLGIVAAAAATVGIIIATGGIAAAAVGGFFAGIVATYGLGATIGFGIAAGMATITAAAGTSGLVGTGVQAVQDHRQEVRNTSTVNINRSLGLDKKDFSTMHREFGEQIEAARSKAEEKQDVTAELEVVHKKTEEERQTDSNRLSR